MSLLELETQVWPTPNHVKLMGNKVQLIEHLDWIAEKLGSPRPRTVILKKGDPVPENAVLKRTHSDQHQHVRIPGHYEGVWDELDEGPDGAVWFAQEYADLLRQVGEWRVVMAGGRIIYVLHTKFDPTNKVWGYTNVHGYLSLNEMR
jgi:hypothetical protein